METMLEKIPFSSDDPENNTCREICVNLYRQLYRKEIKLDEFLKEIAYTALRYGFNELSPLNKPNEPTTEAFLEWEFFSLAQRRKLNQNYYSKYSEINEYFAKKLWVKEQNKAILEWLLELTDYIPQEDIINQEKLKKRIEEFQQADEELCLELFARIKREEGFYNRHGKGFLFRQKVKTQEPIVDKLKDQFEAEEF